MAAGRVKKSIWIGRDRREEQAFQVTRGSVLRWLSESISVHALELAALRAHGLYRRPTKEKNGRLIDVLSARADYDGSMSTDHAIGRFAVPLLAKTGLALFMDGDMLARTDLAQVFRNLDRSKAVHCVQHKHEPMPGTKMDGQLQTRYARKNWSSFIIFDCDHPANRELTVDLINSMPGRDLHGFCWLADHEIGELDPSWNFLVGHSDPRILPNVVHFTEGTPDMEGYHDVPYADEWRRANDLITGALSLPA